VRAFWGSPRWYLLTVVVGVLVILSAIALPDERTKNDIVMGCLFLGSAALGYAGYRSTQFVVRRILSGFAFLLVIAAILTRFA
jgi:hypothetical protein